MLHFLLEIIIMTRSTKTRLLLRDKCKVVHSDRLYRPVIIVLYFRVIRMCLSIFTHMMFARLLTILTVDPTVPQRASAIIIIMMVITGAIVPAWIGITLILN